MLKTEREEKKYLSSQSYKESNVPYLLALVCLLCASFYSLYLRVAGIFGLAALFVFQDTRRRKSLPASMNVEQIQQEIHSQYQKYQILPILKLSDVSVIQDNDIVVHIISFLDGFSLLNLETCSLVWKRKCMRSSNVNVLNTIWQNSFRAYFYESIYTKALKTVSEKFNNSWRPLFRIEYVQFQAMKEQFNWLKRNPEELQHLCQSDRRSRRLGELIAFLPSYRFCKLPGCRCRGVPFVQVRLHRHIFSRMILHIL